MGSNISVSHFTPAVSLVAGTMMAVAYDEPTPPAAVGVPNAVKLGHVCEATIAATTKRSRYFASVRISI